MPYYTPFYFFDYTYILVIIGVIICLIASAGVKSSFNKWSKRGTQANMTASAVAELILRNAGVSDVAVVRTSGNLTDNFNPTTKTLNLSDDVYGSSSIAAIGVAAHEAGHAIQYAENYVPIKIRSALVPVTNFGSWVSMPLILIGCLFNFNQIMITIGILLFSLGLVFALVTLPVEFNASRRAISILDEQNFLTVDELSGAKSVLKAAAMTYVASTLAIALQVLRLVLLFGRKRR